MRQLINHSKIFTFQTISILVEGLPTPKEQAYIKLHKPKLALVVDNTKPRKPKSLTYDDYMQKKLGRFFEFLFEKADI